MRGITFLLIDNDNDDLEIFCLALQDLNDSYQCVTAKNSIEVLEKLKDEFTPDFIFLDLNMPLMSGKEALKEIKKIKRLRDIPVIVYTTSSHEKDIVETRELGANHYFIKPASIGRLSETISLLLKNQSLPYVVR